MPRKKKEELTNIDLIAKRVKKEIDSIKELVKLDGITLEITLKPKCDTATVYDKIRKFCEDFNLNPISLEENKNKEKTFALQFPEFTNNFTDEEKEKLYLTNFKFLIDSLIRNDYNHKVTTNVLRKSRDIVIEQCFSIYFRSYANQYKEKIEDLINNQELKYKMQNLYTEFINEYIIEHDIKEGE